MSFILKIFKWDDDSEVSLLPQKLSENEHFLHRKRKLSGFKWLGGPQAELTCYWLIF